MPSSTSHTAKRPYAGVHSQNQASITSYFPSQQSSLSSSSNATASPLSPPLPATVQANLLSVGMRVRKSVPEGYKTGSYSAFALFHDNTQAQHKATQQQPPPQQSQQQAGQWRSTGSRRELTPFCGLLKVGGLAQQVVNEQVPEEDDLPFLSSQGSTISDVSVASAPGKRRFDDSDEEEEADSGRNMRQQGSLQDEESISPRSKPMARLGLGGRPMAVPLSRRRTGLKKVVAAGLGQENTGMDLDFDEAEFLDYGIWEKGEVDMRDV